MRAYTPMLAQPTTGSGNRRPVELTTIAAIPGWIAQEKHDGLRAIVHTSLRGSRIFNRNGVEITAAFPEVADLKMPQAVFDGELVARDGLFSTVATRDKQRGRTRYGTVAAEREAYRTLAQQNPCYFIAFDLLQDDGEALAGLRLTERLKRMRPLIGRRRNIRPVEQSKDIMRLWREVTSRGGEGIIAKKETSVYLEGMRASTWLKFKATQTITAVAVGYERDVHGGLGAMHLALVDHDKPVLIGKVGTGWTREQAKDLQARLEAGTPILVEVEVLNRTLSELRFAVFRGERADVSFTDATIDQLDAIPFY